MSMQQYTNIEDTYKRQLTCLSWTHRDVVAGYEDGTMKFFDPETGCEKCSARSHTGIIWCFLFRSDSKKLFVGSNDACMSVWYNERVIDIVNFNSPVFSLCCYQADKLIVGLSRECHIYKIETNIKLENEPVVTSKTKDRNKKKAMNVDVLSTSIGSMGLDGSMASTHKPKQHHILLESPLAKLTRHQTSEAKKIVSVGSKFFVADGCGKLCIYDYAILTSNKKNNSEGTQANRISNLSPDPAFRSSNFQNSDGQGPKNSTFGSMAPSSVGGPSSAATTRKSKLAGEIGSQGGKNTTPTQNRIKISCVKSFTAHEAGITAMICVEDRVDNNTFLMTGSFDRTVKIWSSDGKCRHVVDMAMYAQDFCNTVTAISWNEKTRTAWIACESQSCLIFDPKTNENVSDFLAINFNTSDGMAYATGKSQSTKFGLCTIKNIKKQKIMQLAYGNSNKAAGGEAGGSGIMVAGTLGGKLIFWRYQPAGFLTAIKSNTAIESLAYCRKAPILLFSGGVEGDISKWERQACLFMYELNLLPYFEVETRMKLVRKQLDLQGRSDHTQPSSDYTPSKISVPGSQKKAAGAGANVGVKAANPGFNKKARTILRLLYHESKDLLISACEDFNIYIWGFDEDQIRAYSQMAKQATGPKASSQSSRAPSHVMGPMASMGAGDSAASDDVTNRVAGFICQYVFFGHENIVTSLAEWGSNLLISSSWDKKLFVWDLDELDFIGALSIHGNITKNSADWADAADYEVIDICAAPAINRIALASTDSSVYIRDFYVDVIKPKEGQDLLVEQVSGNDEDDLTPRASVPPNRQRKKSIASASLNQISIKHNKKELKITYKISCPLIGVLQHDHEVNAVCYVEEQNWWITASQDERIRIWDGKCRPEKLHKKVYEILCNCPISVLTVDKENQVILAALDNMINIYDLYTGKLLQVKSGHSENVRCILSIPERSQYISGSWDRQVLIWPAYKKPKNALFSYNNSTSNLAESEGGSNVSPRSSVMPGRVSQPGGSGQGVRVSTSNPEKDENLKSSNEHHQGAGSFAPSKNSVGFKEEIDVS